jgi:hypothetical protein
MTLSHRRRTDPAAFRAYTVPVVREVPIGHGSGQASSGPHSLGQPVAYAADSHAW